MLQNARRDGAQTVGHIGLGRALMAYQPEESHVISKQGKLSYAPDIHEL
jgi:hypothetical protein